MNEEMIWWNDFCGNGSIYDAFWDHQLTINTTAPDFTNCFQKTFLTWICCGFLWILSILYVPFLIRKPEKLIPWSSVTKFHIFKLGVGSCLIILSLIDLISFGGRRLSSQYVFPRHPLPVDFVDAILRMFTFIFSTVLTHWTFRKRIHSPGVLFFFWFLQLISGIVTFRSFILQGHPTDDEMLQYITFFIRFGFISLSFGTCLFPDLHRSVRSARRDSERSPLIAETEVHLLEESENSESNPCPKLKSPFLSVLFFWWFTPTIITGWRRTLTNSDIWDIRKEDSCSRIVPIFQNHWENERSKNIPKTRSAFNASDKENGYLKQSNKFKSKSEEKREKRRKKASLFKALAKTFLPYFSLAGVLLFTYDLVAFINPYILNTLLSFVESKDPFAWHGYILAVTMFISSIVGVLCMHHHFNYSYTTGLRVRTALTAAIYRKALKISPASRKNVTVGEIVNLMSVDTQKCQDACAFMHYIWSSPIMVIIAVFFLWQILGPSTMAGVGFMLVVLPVNSTILAKKIREFQKKQMTLKDSRIKLMNQILSGIKILKLYAWEPYFASKILAVREEELKVLKKSAILGAVTYIMWFCSSFVVALLCFLTYVLSSPNNILNAQKAFVSMSLIMLMNFPLTMLPPSIMIIVQAGVSLKRIEAFLLQEDINSENVQHDNTINEAVVIDNGSFSWGDSARTLVNINLKIPEGKLVAIVGHVGCGKSSLLSALLGEMQKESGFVNVKGRIAYVPQQAWIQNMSLKDNILFSKSLNESSYDCVLDACALRPDLAILPAGDATEIGERGINLSGGQKQRVSLARAVYQDADVYLLDDTLSAVDAHVGKHIFNQVIGPEGILANKTRILVTHGIGFLSKVDEIIVLKDGVITENGTFKELLIRDGAFAEFIRTYMKETNGQDDEVKEQVKDLQRRISMHLSEPDAEERDGGGGGDTISEKSTETGKSSLKSQTLRKRKSFPIKTDDEIAKEAPSNVNRKKLIEEEVSEEGAVKLSVLKSYLSAAAPVYSVVAFLSIAFFIAAQVATNIWLSKWTQDPTINGTQDKQLTNLRLGVYGGLGAAQTISVFGIAASISLGSIYASRTLHSGLLHNILKCPMSFFDTTPLGRIVNRFSKDIDVLDVNIPQFSQNLMTTLVQLISTIIIIIYSTPIFVVVIIPLIIFFVLVQRVYVACARQIKRIDSVRRSPLYAFFSETLNGTSSIRAYKQEPRFIEHSDDLLDSSQRVWFEAFTSNRWIGVWAEATGDIIIFFTAFFAVLERETLNSGLIGLSLSFVLQINMAIVFSVRSSCELETYIVAVERIKEYSELQSESPWTMDDHKVSDDWPSDGNVEFKDYSTRYREGLDLVLREISFQIQSGEKVGIVGRTGAGKSSMTLALFRIIEASNGRIEIDGVDLSSIGLHDIRRNLTVIPQDPVIFSGSIRFNLDPSDNFSDDEIWKALEHAHLKNFIYSLPDKIEHECGEDGENLSVGQRQLICLARALLRKSKILVLDEATAAVDLETDDLIQSTISNEFKDSTVLTIAHRLNTIMDYERVLVLQDGQIKEFRSPNDLLADRTSLFFSMAKDAGLA